MQIIKLCALTTVNPDVHYVKFKSGLILQWGYVDKGSQLKNGDSWVADIKLPCVFTGTNYTVVPMAEISNCNGEEIVLRNVTESSFSLSMYNRNGTTNMTSPKMRWFAIGV